MHSCILNLTIAIGTFLNYMENGPEEGGYFISELKYAWRDWRPVYGPQDITSSMYMLGSVLSRIYEPALKQQFEQKPILLRKDGS